MNISSLGRALAGALCLVTTIAFPSAKAAQSAQPAQDWPQRPVTVVVPFPPGGGIDTVARIVMQRVAEQIGQPVVIENQGGGGGTIASQSVARAAPDGHTLVFHSVSGAVANAVTLKNLPYDPINDFAPVTLVSRFPLVMVINRDIPAKNLQEFVELIRKNPGKYSYGSSGVGTSIHIAAELFTSLAGAEMLHVPYRGTVSVVPDLMAGRISMLIDGLPPQLGNIRTDKLRAIGVSTTTRSDLVPDVPAINEVLPGYDVPFWTGMFAPKGTPAPVLERIAEEVHKAVRHPETAKKLESLGIEGVGSTPAEFDKYWRDQLALYAKIVESANIRVE